MKNLVPALIKAQAEFKPIVKDKVNPFFHSKYADLENVIECTKKALADNGLVVIQTFGVLEGKTTLWTYLYHTSGEFISGSQYLDVATDPQKIASASTYARRYGYLAILGIAAEDDDGNEASQEKPVKQADKAAEPHKTASQASMNVANPPVAEAKPGKVTLIAECLGVTYNEKKLRSEYEIETADHEHYIVFVKKPQITVQERQKLQFIGFWESEFKGKDYQFADDVKPVPAIDDEEIPF